ncbi:MAG: hypothetical protein R3Y54_07880 [Eubacteriales bacterium]
MNDKKAIELGLAKYSFHHVCDENSTLLLEDGSSNYTELIGKQYGN